MEQVYITKFALKTGVIYGVAATISGDRATIKGALPWTSVSFGKGDWHRTREEAAKRANQMAVAKANSLEREAARFRALIIPVVGE